ncbi:hypothetical protein HMPREF9418_0443 [Neisseria macacae ATCC 33926]|uniref:Uncharacterized protein n=1 Tax=Neisseria macacae ATCC 33926 TaxID=997348 RepID=A0AA36XLH9_9NEIS|nr:hypothetical protein HMPREF9418_0443 [Neisseria macacae ATCC 33926]
MFNHICLFLYQKDNELFYSTKYHIRKFIFQLYLKYTHLILISRSLKKGKTRIFLILFI